MRKGGVVLVISILAVTAGCSSGSGGLQGVGGAGGVSPGHDSPKAAADGFITDLVAGGTSWCSYVDPADQSTCVTGASEAGLTVTGTFQIRNQVIVGSEAIVSVTGSLCTRSNASVTTAGGCDSNSDPDAGLPPGAGTFAVAYSAAVNNSTDYNAVPCVAVNGSWYVNATSLGSTTPTTVPATTPTTTPTTVPTTTPTTTPSPATTTATTVVP